MQFSDLYQTELTRELGSADRVNLFTDARRKAAINAAQLEWLKRTECFTLEYSLALVDGTGEYDLEASISDFGWIAKGGVSIKIVDGSGNVRYVEGNDLTVVTTERLDTEQSGWRAATKGTPTHVYVRRNGGTLLLGFTPAIGTSAGETWTALVRYVIIPADMTQDADVPFTIAGNALLSMRPWHRALAHYGAFDCEKYRKDQARGAAQLQLFEAEVQKFIGIDKPKGPRRVRLIRDYRQDARRGTPRPGRFDPRVQ